MRLNRIISPVEITEIIGEQDKEITAITSDSRRVEPGTLFVAVPGVSVDGHDSGSYTHLTLPTTPYV